MMRDYNIIRNYVPSFRDSPKLFHHNQQLSAWLDIPTIIKDIIQRFGIEQNNALEFGVEYGYSTSALSNYFKTVIGVDTFIGDDHAGIKSNHFKQTVEDLKGSWQNIKLIESTYQDFISDEINDISYDLIHIDIFHTYEETFPCGEWAVNHSDVVLFHDTESHPAIKDVCYDLAMKYNLKFYNYPDSHGLGILVKNIPKKKIYYHLYAVNNWKEVTENIFEYISNENGKTPSNQKSLCEVIEGMYIFAYVPDDSVYAELTDLVESTKETMNGKVTIQKVSYDMKLNETSTLKALHDDCVNNTSDDFEVLYLHSKGVTQPCDVTDWVNYMLYFNVSQWHECELQLRHHDVCGVEFSDTHKDLGISRTDRTWWYAGNFWWTSSDYIKTRLSSSIHSAVAWRNSFMTVEEITEYYNDKNNKEIFEEIWACSPLLNKEHETASFSCLWKSGKELYNESFSFDEYENQGFMKSYEQIPKLTKPLVIKNSDEKK